MAAQTQIPLWVYYHLPVEDWAEGLKPTPGDEGEELGEDSPGDDSESPGGGDNGVEPDEEGKGEPDSDSPVTPDETEGGEDDIGDFPFPDEDDEEGDEFDDDDEAEVGNGIDEPEDEESEPEQETPIPFILTPAPTGGRVLVGFDRVGDEWIRDFRSWHEFVTSAIHDPSSWADRSSHDAERGRKGGWYGTPDFETAIEMALRSGWPEGRELLSECLVAIPPRPRIFESVEFEVAGAFPNIPLYCAGDPACMVLDPGLSLRASKPIIRIDYNHWVVSSVTPKDMMLRGAAIVSLADSLERQGFSTELRIIGNSRAGFMKTGKVFRYNIVYKEAGQPLDIDRAAFAIAHPSSMRRLAFAIMEQHPDLEEDFSGSYGYPMHESNDPTSGQFGGAIFVPGSHGNETPESAKAAVETAAQNLLSNIHNLAA